MKHDPVAKRRPTNVSLPEDIVLLAKEYGVNVSQACSAGLAIAVKKERERRWREENRAAIQSWNEWYEKNGDPLAHLRPL